MSDTHYDFIAVGLGPFNLSLACLTESLDDMNGLVLDQNAGFDWHPGMMLQNATLQTPFLADLVTLADPTHPLSFLNYIKAQGRIYSFYIRESFFLMRKEYNQYCQWACEQVTNIRFNTRVENIDFDAAQQLYCVECVKTNGKPMTYLTKKLVLGTGPQPHIPQGCQNLGASSIHSSNYLPQKAKLQQQSSITVVGSGQSAAEIFHDLLQDINTLGYQLNWIARAPRFFPLEYSKLTLEMTSPEYVDYFHQLPQSKKDQLIKNQAHLYKGINATLINEIFDLLYIKQLYQALPVRLLTNCDLRQANVDSANNQTVLQIYQHEQQQLFELTTDSVVFATGFAYQPPEFLAPISNRIKWDDKGRFAVNRNYSIDHGGNEIYVQNAELHSHGFVTPDLGMACYRNAWLIREISGVEHYPIEEKIAFQQFAPDMPAKITKEEALV